MTSYSSLLYSQRVNLNLSRGFMKVLKIRYDYIFLIYMPIALVGIVLAFCLPNGMLKSFYFALPMFLLPLLFLVLSPYGKRRLLTGNTAESPTYNVKRWLGLSIGLQLAMTLIFYSLAQVVIAIVPLHDLEPTALTSPWQTTYTFFLGGFYPWPMCILLGLILAFFSADHKQPALLRTAVRPVLKKINDSIIGYGIEVFIKQGLMLVTALMMGLEVLQICQLLNTPLTLPRFSVSAFSTQFLGILVVLIFMNQPAQRGLQILWSKGYSTHKILFLFSGLLLLVILSLTAGIKLITFYLSNLTTQMPALARLSLHRPWQTDWLLLAVGWWVCWLPLLAPLLLKFAKGRSIRGFCLANLLLPACFGLFWWLNQHGLLPAQLPHFIAKTLHLWPINLLIALGGLVLVIKLYKDPEIAGLVSASNLHCNAQQRATLNLLRSLMLLSICLLAMYMLSDISFIGLFTIGVSLPIFLSICLAALGALLTYRNNN